MEDLQNQYTEDIEGLKRNLFQTGIQVEEMLLIAFDALFEHNEDKQVKAARKYSKIINLQMEIEAKVLNFLSKFNPGKEMFRDIISIMKISVHLERIATRCSHIAKTEISIPSKELRQDLLKLKNMVEKSIDMFLIVLDAFRNGDEKKARKIARKEEEIINLYHRFNTRVISGIQKNPEDTEEYLKLVYLNRDIERLTEHLASICEWIYFDITGEYINLRASIGPSIR